MKSLKATLNSTRRTWYGWNLDSYAGAAFARMVERHFRKHRKFHTKRKLFHPWIPLAWGGLWKPLSLPQPVNGDAILNFRWRTRRRKYL